MASPRPVPPYLRLREGVNLTESPEEKFLLVIGDANTGVGDGESEYTLSDGCSTIGCDFYLNLSPIGELDGVAGEVDEDLPQPHLVSDHRIRHIPPPLKGRYRVPCGALRE